MKKHKVSYRLGGGLGSWEYVEANTKDEAFEYWLENMSSGKSFQDIEESDTQPNFNQLVSGMRGGHRRDDSNYNRE